MRAFAWLFLDIFRERQRIEFHEESFAVAAMLALKGTLLSVALYLLLLESTVLGGDWRRVLHDPQQFFADLDFLVAGISWVLRPSWSTEFLFVCTDKTESTHIFAHKIIIFLRTPAFFHQIVEPHLMYLSPSLDRLNDFLLLLLGRQVKARRQSHWLKLRTLTHKSLNVFWWAQIDCRSKLISRLKEYCYTDMIIESRLPKQEKAEVIAFAKKYSVTRLANDRWTEVNPAYVHTVIFFQLLERLMCFLIMILDYCWRVIGRWSQIGKTRLSMCSIRGISLPTEKRKMW